jgi:hypothetical protein
VSRPRRLAVLAALGALASGCGAVETPEQARQVGATPSTSRPLGPRYGIAVTLPAGWDGRIGRGALHAGSFPLPGDAPGWTRTAAKGLAPDDVLVTIFENEPRRSPPLQAGEYPELNGPLRLDTGDFEPFDGVTEDSGATGNGYARRTFRLSGRFFVLFAEAGERVPPPAALAALNELLASLAVEPGDFFPGTVAPARFPQRAGWFVGTGGPDEARAEGEFTTAWAATIPYADEWNALPPFETLRRLPREGIVIWVGLSRSNRFPPRREGDDTFPAREPPFSLAEFEPRGAWEGQVRDLPEYLLQATVRGQYNVDLRVYFGRPNPSEETRSQAQAMLERLELPDWGPWQTP